MSYFRKSPSGMVYMPHRWSVALCIVAFYLFMVKEDLCYTYFNMCFYILLVNELGF